MKESGDFAKEDPWGALAEGDHGQGSSTVTEELSLEEIAEGFRHQAAAKKPFKPAEDPAIRP
ncbi:MAG: hypothetical protein Q9190_004018, partial [Brigantiaea leucoxantha]